MKKTKQALLAAPVAVLLAGGGLALAARHYYAAPGPLAAEKTVILARGEGFRGTADALAAQGVIRHPRLFEIIAAALGEARRFKAGEYRFPAAASPRFVMAMIAQGRVVEHKLTVPEGWTARQVGQLLLSEKALDGPLPDSIPEGSLLPETYHFIYGEKRAALIAQMQAAMTKLLAKLWTARKPGLPLATPQQALTLASIVEKETGVAGERGRVAAVFVNRLKRGMKLQSDPTVAYGVGKPGDKLTVNDLRAPTAYNTYVIPGLPPGPIANPGEAALEAALNPPDTNDLYFVASGSGGHRFAATLKEHDKNVRRYHQTVRKPH